MNFQTAFLVLIGISSVSAGFDTIQCQQLPQYDISTSIVGSNGVAFAQGNVDCIIANDADQDFLNTDPPTVNDETCPFFDITSWAYAGKIGTNVCPGCTGSGEGQSGSYNFCNVDLPSGVPSNVNTALVVFKSGSSKSGLTLVGFRVDLTDPTQCSGTWTSPFKQAPFNLKGSGAKAVSHITIYFCKGKPFKSNTHQPN